MRSAHWPPNNGRSASSGAEFDLRGYALRPDTFTSADAAGLPIFPLLVRYDEASAGQIRHPIRFTARVTRTAHVWPARHDAGSTSSLGAPPMGQRFRLRASKDISSFSPRVKAIFQGFKTYGLVLADNGSDWFISGIPGANWNNDEPVTAFAQLKGSDFEAVGVSSLLIDPDSGQARQPGLPAFGGGVFVAAGASAGTGRIVTGAGPGGGPHVRAFDGSGHDAGVSFFAYSPGFPGGVRVAVEHLDPGSAGAEIVTGPGPGGSPHVRSFTGTGAAGTATFLAY